jgi:amidohydrolase
MYHIGIQCIKLLTQIIFIYITIVLYTSTACGHDGHVSILLMTAKILCQPDVRSRFSGCIKLLFQPAEEDGNGAKHMVEAGCLDGRENEKLGPAVEQVYGLHLITGSPTGCVDIKFGELMASIDEVDIEVIGKGGHGAFPESANDAIIAACSLVNNLTTIIPRNVSALDTAVFTLGQFNAGYARNVIADKCKVRGTVRTFSPAIRDLMEKRIREICDGTAATFQLEIKLHYFRDYNVTKNYSQQSVQYVRDAAAKVVGNNVREAQVLLGSEDFSEYLDALQNGAFCFVGAHPTNKSKEIDLYPHHKSTFDFDEAAMNVGVSMWLYLVESIMG